MPREPRARSNHVKVAALLVAGAVLLAAAVLGIYETSLAKAHAVWDVVPEGTGGAAQYLPGSTSQIGTLREPLMKARRAALRDGLDREDAPIDAYDRLRSVPGHEDEARSLLAQFWARKAMRADDPVRRVLYALQARVVNDDDSTRRAAASAIAALGPLRKARHIADGTSDACAAPPEPEEDGATQDRGDRPGVAETMRPSERRLPRRKKGEIEVVEACATRVPRCVVRDSSGVGTIWDFGPAKPRRIFEGVDCEARRFSPDGTRLMCRESQDGTTFYSEDEAGDWGRTDVVLPPLDNVFVQDDGTVCGAAPSKDLTSGADALIFALHECWAPPAVERTWSTIRMQPDGTGAVFTFPPPGGGRGGSGNAEFFGFGAKGESLASASNAWFGARGDERLLEYDATNSAGAKSYELDGMFFESGRRGRGRRGRLLGADRPGLLRRSAGAHAPRRHRVHEGRAARAAPGRGALGPPREALLRAGGAGEITAVAPAGDAVVLDGRIERLGACGSESAFEPTDVTDVVAVGPGASLWVTRSGESLALHGVQRDALVVPSPVPRATKGGAAEVAFSASGDRFFVKNADSLCKWLLRDDGTLDLDGCRWSTGGWVSDAAWAASDKASETVAVFDRTAEGAALREFFSAHELEAPVEFDGDLACSALPRPNEPPLSVLKTWERRLGHRFKDQATTQADARERTSPENRAERRLGPPPDAHFAGCGPTLQ